MLLFEKLFHWIIKFGDKYNCGIFYKVRNSTVGLQYQCNIYHCFQDAVITEEEEIGPLIPPPQGFRGPSARPAGQGRPLSQSVPQVTHSCISLYIEVRVQSHILYFFGMVQFDHCHSCKVWVKHYIQQQSIYSWYKVSS